MTTPDLPTLRRLLAEAGPLPWAEDHGDIVYDLDNQHGPSVVADDVMPDKAVLIVAAVNALPGLLDRIEKLERDVAKADAYEGHLRGMLDRSAAAPATQATLDRLTAEVETLTRERDEARSDAQREAAEVVRALDAVTEARRERDEARATIARDANYIEHQRHLLEQNSGELSRCERELADAEAAIERARAAVADAEREADKPSDHQVAFINRARGARLVLEAIDADRPKEDR